jgi:hypothetical protein
MEGTFTQRITKTVIEYRTPEEALRLTEDVQALRQAVALLKTVDRYNVADDPDKDTLFFCVQRLKEFERYARRKLAVEYLDPRRTKIERNRKR